MLSFRTTIERKRAQSFVTNVHAWYQTCIDISEVMDDPCMINQLLKRI
jgi:hypothetical protein